MSSCFHMEIKDRNLAVSMHQTNKITSALPFSITRIASYLKEVIYLMWYTEWVDYSNSTLWTCTQKLSDRLQYVRHIEYRLYAELYQGLTDATATADGQVDGSQIGKKVMLSSSFTAGPRYQHQLYQDAMAIVHHYGNPDFFIACTCNQRWQEITDDLLPQQTVANHADIVARVFKLKLHSLLWDVYYKSTPVLGKVIGLIYVVEWQKCGPPHAPILAIYDSTTKPHTPKDSDDTICVEIQDEEKFPELPKTSLANPKSPCMEDGKCTKNSQRRLWKKPMKMMGTLITNGEIMESVSWKWVIPYNPFFFSKKYNVHINVAICSSIQSCKYLYKYVYKGPDMASAAAEHINKIGDEIHKYVNSQFVTVSKAWWRIYEFDIHGRQPTIQCLAVHEKKLQTIIFDEAHPEDNIANVKHTTLLGWFKLNRTDPDARNFKYHEIPGHYV